MSTVAKKIFSFRTFLILFFIGCLVCILPFSRNIIIALMEKIIGRGLKDMVKWNAVIVGSFSFFATLAVFAYFLLYTKTGVYVAKKASKDIKCIYFNKKTLTHLAFLSFIYCAAYLTLFRANYDFQDDIKRIISGHKSWVGASRYISESLSVFLHTNFYLNDIAPITQILAALIMAVASFTLCYTLTEGKATKLTLASSTLLGLCPFFFENMSYKFDSPYMALAMLFGVLPFLFIRNKTVYAVVSFMSLIFVCSSYQAGNSIYIILALTFTLKFIIEEKDIQGGGYIFRHIGSVLYCFARGV